MSNLKVTGGTIGAMCFLSATCTLAADSAVSTNSNSTTNATPAKASEDVSRFSDQPAPLRLNDFPDRPPPLLELGDHFLGTGNLKKGFTLPTGAVWSPDLWVYGTLRSAVQTFDPGGSGTRYTEWANRLDIYGNLYLAPTERVLIGWRPIDRNGTTYSGYLFEPHSQRGFVNASSATPRTIFFEGQLDELFPYLDPNDSRSLDYAFAVGRQPLNLQDGLLANSAWVDMVSVTRNALTLPYGSTLRLSALEAWSQIQRQDYTSSAVPNSPDHDANLFGFDAAADFPVSTVEGTVLYEASSAHGDGFYAGLGSLQRIWKFNTTFRAETSLATDGESAKVTTGTLLLSQVSYDLPYSADLVYLDAFWGIDRFSSAVRDPTAGGPLGLVGLLNAAVGLGHYGAPLSNEPDDAAGAAIGYQMFFGELRRRQLIVEVGGRAPTSTPTYLRQRSAEGIAVRFQQAIGRRYVLIVDTFGVARDDSSASVGGRMELTVKF